MKIIYLIAGTYRSAGMERVLAHKVNALAADGYELVVATTDQRGCVPAFDMDESIRTVDLGINYEETNGKSFLGKAWRYPMKQLRHFHRLRALLMGEKPDVTVSMFCNDAAFLPFIKDGSRKVLEVHFSRYKRLQYRRRGIWAIADRIRSANDSRIAARYDRFVVLTEEDRLYWGDLKNIRVIPNPRPFIRTSPAALENKIVIAVGRYTRQKGFDMLLEAWGSIDTAGWTLRIVGSGTPLRGIPENVVTGPSPDIVKEYSESSVFVLSSRYEGMPMALLEAQACGLPSVAFECKCGPKDVITDRKDGFLVREGDIVSLAAKIKMLMDDKELRIGMGTAAFANSERFDSGKIMAEWKKLFRELL